MRGLLPADELDWCCVRTLQGRANNAHRLWLPSTGSIAFPRGNITIFPLVFWMRLASDNPFKSRYWIGQAEFPAGRPIQRVVNRRHHGLLSTTFLYFYYRLARGNTVYRCYWGNCLYYFGKTWEKTWSIFKKAIWTWACAKILFTQWCVTEWITAVLGKWEFFFKKIIKSKRQYNNKWKE